MIVKHAAKKVRCKTLICVLEFPNHARGESFNVGTVMRNCDALGVGSLYIITEDPQSWSSIRKDKGMCTGAMSANMWLYTRVFSTTAECLAHLEKKNFKSIVTSPYNKSKENFSLTGDCPLYTHHHLTVWFGNESRGISDDAAQAASACIQLPMCGFVESFNLGTTTGIVMHHIANIRRAFSQRKADARDERSETRLSKKRGIDDVE